ncbi:TetR/AcrR family transcriptional regulator [Cloacibacterium sp.]|uniref:TetR/AcrR family transcriptional regulator n=1 Tax=Cloacibacterium sp. TaxID=1913682 RepID=UPI0035AD90E2
MKNKNINKEKLLSLYGDYILSNGEKPKNIYLFAKENDFEEENFYQYFSGFEQIEKEILNHFFTKSLELCEQTENWNEMTSKEKLLNLHFTFFENLTMNRSLVLMILGETKRKEWIILQELRKNFLEFTKQLTFENLEILEKAKESIKNFNEKTREEALWLHFISIIEFWKKDQSPSFEKTDLYIEKTIDTGFEFINNEPLKKVMDLGKFLWKEKFKV